MQSTLLSHTNPGTFIQIRQKVVGDFFEDTYVRRAVRTYVGRSVRTSVGMTLYVSPLGRSFVRSCVCTYVRTDVQTLDNTAGVR